MREWIKELRKPGEAYRSVGLLAAMAGFLPPIFQLEYRGSYRAFGRLWSGEWIVGPHILLAAVGLWLYMFTASNEKDADPTQDRPVMYRALSLSAFIWWSCWLAEHLRA